MPSLKDIRGRIGSVRNIAQITRAMEMVAASRMKRAQDAIIAARPYSDQMRDVLSRVMAGGWRSLTLGFGATALALAIGLPIALAGGYFRGRTDQILMRFVDAVLSIPTLVFVANGTVVGRTAGLVPEAGLRRALHQLVEAAFPTRQVG